MVAINNKIKKLIILASTIVVALLLFGIWGIDAKAYTPNIVHLGNHQTYDITNAPNNTIVQIDDASIGSNGIGNVTLKGSSDKAWVHIEVSKGKTVIVDMEDGLDIHPGYWSAYGIGANDDTLGWSRSAIYIDETSKAGGIVILRSMKNATIKLDSYQDTVWQALPAIMKNNTKTKLVFETEDKNNPGTIIARPSFINGFYGSCAIGAYGHGVLGQATSSYKAGNIDFHSGNIEAYGRVDGPGIGAYEYSHVGELSFSGAHVVSKAGNWGAGQCMVGAAGIGAAYRGNVDKITISDGYVEAWGMGAGKSTRNRPLKEIQSTAGCGIGSGWLASHLGEIEISGGTVKAYGGTCAQAESEYISGCGIGTCVATTSEVEVATADKITITGGDITAVGGSSTCGIGGCVKDIVISPKDDNTDLRINASIDSTRTDEGDLTFLGSGIGIANNAMVGRYTRTDYPGNITITGGDIYTQAGRRSRDPYDYNLYCGSGIGPCSYGRISNLTITGGTIYATGGWNAPGIGGPNGCASDYNQTVDNIYISGGTITATMATYNGKDVKRSGIGGYKVGNSERTNIVITGGNVISEGDDYAIGYDANGQPKNSKGEPVYGTKFFLNPDIGEWAKVESFYFNPTFGYDYGLKDVYTREGLGDDAGKFLLDFWIPRGTSSYVCDTKIKGHAYKSNGSIELGDNNTLNGYTDITYVNDITGTTYSGRGGFGDKKLSIDPVPMQSPGIMQCYNLVGYKDDNGNVVATGGYGDNAPTLEMGTEYVDFEGKWKANYGNLNLKLDLVQTKYLVSYDANKPEGASHNITGTMTDDLFELNHDSQLTDNAYELVGWKFKGWSTSPTGQVEYNDKANINYQGGDHLKLYAVWERMPYQITFTSGLAGLADYLQNAYYDLATKLEKYSDELFGWTNRSNILTQSLHGWKGEGFGSFFSDNEDIFNFIQKDGNGNPVYDEHGDLKGRTLTAVWVDEGKIAVSVTKDGVPIKADGSAGSITKEDFVFKDENGNSILLPEPSNYANVLVFEPASVTRGTTVGQLPAGHYYMWFDPASNPSTKVTNPGEYKAFLQEIDYTVGASVSSVYDYNTITMHADNHIQSTNVKESGTSEPHNTLTVPDDYDVVIEANAESGYHFDGYSYYGVEPTWKKGKKVANQSVTVRGEVDLTAHAEANVYHIVYDKNKPVDASHSVVGSMTNQDFVYDEAQTLRDNKYSLVGWAFTGWNTKADGKGKFIANNESMDSAKWNEIGPPENDAEVRLYAQWTPNAYFVYFIDDYATSGGMQPQEMLYDKAANLYPNEYMRTDYHFVGWNTIPSGFGESYEDRERVSSLTTSSSIPLYSQWEHDYYTIIFDKNDVNATGEMSNIKASTNTVYEVPYCLYMNKGHTFLSWNTKPDGSGTTYNIGDKIENLVPKGGSITLYAQWERNTYTITYDLNGGVLDGKTGIVEVNAKYGDKIILPLPSREGYNFKYWKGSTYYAGEEYEVEDNHTLTAEWEEINSSGNNDATNSSGTKGALARLLTGDNAPIVLAIVMILAGVVVIVTVLLIRRRKNHKK